MRPAPAEGVSCAALDWVAANRSGFTLPDDVLARHTDVNQTLKPLGELAQLCASISRHTAPREPRHRIARELMDFAWRQTGRGGLLLELLRREPFAVYPLEIYAAFAGEGMRHRGVEALAATMTRTRGWRLMEQDPNRRLGVLNCEARIGLPRHETQPTALRRTWLGGLPEPWTFERTAGYALTHTVFHLTDWGNAPHRVPHDLGGYLRTWLPSWTDCLLEDEQWDLACELLAVAASLPEPPDPEETRDAWTVVAGGQHPSGALPEAGPKGGERAVGRSFADCYHSTLVAAFAAALAAARLREARAGRPFAGYGPVGEPA